jgi:transglutaminase-like putative cysteine protease
MLYSLSHRTKLNYSEPISESVLEIRAMPHSNQRQVLRQFNLKVVPDTKICHHTDWLENTVHYFSILGRHDRIAIASYCTVETRPAPRVLESSVLLLGLANDHRFLDFLSHQGPANNDPNLLQLASQIGLGQARTVEQAIVAVMSRTRDFIGYQRGVTASDSNVSDVLRVGAGVCQDFAHLSLALLRRVGVPCRYVSGYLYRGGQSEVETHAWSEAFMPGAGWVAFDAARRQLVDEAYISGAAGRNYSDVPPNRGVYRGNAKECLEVSVVIKPAEESTYPAYLSASSRPAASERLVQPVSSMGLMRPLAKSSGAAIATQPTQQLQQ